MNAANGAPASSRPHPRVQKPHPHMQKSVRNLAYDAVELGELQLRLIKLDTQEAGREVRLCCVLSAVGVALLLASLPVALLAIAEGLVQYMDLPRATALGVSAATALIFSGGFMIAGWRTFSRCLVAWHRSTEEFNRNVAWLKTTLQSDNDERPRAPSGQFNP